MQDELSIEKARVAILVEERNELLRKVFELEEQVRRLIHSWKAENESSYSLRRKPSGNDCL